MSDEDEGLSPEEAARSRMYRLTATRAQRLNQMLYGEQLLYAVGIVAIGLATTASAAPVPVVAGLLAVIAALAVVSWRDTRRLDRHVLGVQNSRETRWLADRQAMIDDVRHDIEHGRAYTLRNDWFDRSWRSVSWWAKQVGTLVCIGGVAVAPVAAFGWPPLLGACCAAAYLGLVAWLPWAREQTFQRQRRTVLEGLLALGDPQSGP